ncbi:MAG: TerB family tellurite resistance protein [Cytophagaceae bacterium]|jgi:uncharacterized tellurite resistance protein B-like protein|nr:TerB family tellurite resistance protein [Cytophagaceae bacterium]
MFTLFSTPKTTAVKKNYLLSLVKLAKADGFVSDAEFDLLIKIGKRQGMSQAEVIELMEDAEEFFYRVPTTDTERFDQLFDMVELMMVDGRIDEKEKTFIIQVAEKMGVRPAVSWILINNLIEGIKAKSKKKSLKASVSNYMFM